MAQDKIKHSKMAMLLIALGVSALVLLLYEFGVFRNAELLTLDYRFYINSITPGLPKEFGISKNKAKGKYSEEQEDDTGKEEFAIALIDVPASGSDIRTCLPPEICANLIKILSSSGARMIMVNSVLSDPLSDPGYTNLGSVIKSAEDVYLPIIYELDKDKMEFLYAGDGVGGVMGPRSFFYGEHTELGYINAFPDVDKQLRRVPAMVRHKGKESYYLGLEMAFDAMGISSRDVQFDPENHTIILTLPSGAKNVIPLENDNQLMINWGSAEKSPIPHFNYRDIIESQYLEINGFRPIVKLNTFSGKICIIGTIESNNIVGKPLTMEGDYATSGACATVIDSTLKASFVRHLPVVFNIAIIILVSLIMVNSLLSRGLLGIMMIMVLFTASLISLYVYGMLNFTTMIVAVVLSIIIGILLSSFSLFSAFIFTILGILTYFIVSVGIFKLFNLDIVTLYPAIAILMIFISFYAYTRILSLKRSLQLFNMASRDGLTGLYNRGHLNTTLDSEIRNIAMNKRKKLSIIMCDIDNFKQLNDTHGHQAGDEILKEYAKILRSKCRKTDIVARYGGEEFMVVLPGAVSGEAYNVAELMRRTIEAKMFKFKNEDYHTTLSMGLVEATMEKTKEELIEKADQALYKAKKEGKNRVIIY